MTLAKRFLFDTRNVVPATSISPAQMTLPSSYDPFIAPGTYAVYDNEYDCSVPGLYSWHTRHELNVMRRIVRGGIYETLSAMCWARTHGSADNTMALIGVNSASHHARARKLRLTCGNLIEWMRAWLPQWGYQHRQLSVLTQEPTNNVDDGHITLEVMVDGTWRMFDVANGVYFTEDGNHIDTQRFMAMMQAGQQPETHVLCPTTFNADLYLGQFDYASYADMAWRFPEDRWDWYRRIFQSVVSIT